MSKCQDENKKYPELSNLSDKHILQVANRHRDEQFWRIVPAANVAYVRRWGFMIRREARRRGIL